MKPFPQSFWIHPGLLCAGAYPGAPDAATRDAKLQGLLDYGIRRVLSLMEPNETDYGGRPFEPYWPRLQALAAQRQVAVGRLNGAIRDAHPPQGPMLLKILSSIESGLRAGVPTYVHCWGGHGRTGTVVACHLMQRGASAQQAIDRVLALRAGLPKHHFPFEGEQERFVRAWRPQVLSVGGLDD